MIMIKDRIVPNSGIKLSVNALFFLVYNTIFCNCMKRCILLSLSQWNIFCIYSIRLFIHHHCRNRTTFRRLNMDKRKILFIRELQSKIRYVCDSCHESKLLEYLAMDERNNMFTVCKECSEQLKKLMDAA